ncbi:hypothetical protein VCHC46B1_1796 [Vibrio cholerae HC-46B1]|nr:hypothetical protein VCHE48_1011 [Vibrio cholerae HE48]EJH52564.1 hypothetical protein VCHC43B1_1873 [Vibrio cholerae HC-43B1]EJH60933.1 hypothetical protein VCHE45_3022 [Vibrio cholerae HE-45]EKK97994.1 hypothetical protein VCCP1035_1579 [Vibrio cholerae CP1035(8)]EKL03274.1 hypothetical protein VCHC41B1_1649 [Vibrio cholerae HC-41B1]EKL96855.1 hypothetical protein VCHC46B1_1796 [Vibrio cholerae HC-46B1]EKM03963.1 hypothetical protein VCHC44C1_1739 [Vibrio cholerae HC-44C1]EMP87327.1 hyp
MYPSKLPAGSFSFCAHTVMGGYPEVITLLTNCYRDLLSIGFLDDDMST